MTVTYYTLALNALATTANGALHRHCNDACRHYCPQLREPYSDCVVSAHWWSLASNMPCAVIGWAKKSS